MDIDTQTYLISSFPFYKDSFRKIRSRVNIFRNKRIKLKNLSRLTRQCKRFSINFSPWNSLILISAGLFHNNSMTDRKTCGNA